MEYFEQSWNDPLQPEESEEANNKKDMTKNEWEEFRIKIENWRADYQDSEPNRMLVSLTEETFSTKDGMKCIKKQKVNVN